MKSAKKRHGFTLVELLTVVVIIGVLVGLIVPAVQSARQAARMAECTNRVKDLCTGVQIYVKAKQRYPAYRVLRGQVSGADVYNSWVVELFSYIGRTDLAEEWRTAAGARRVVYIDQLVCPNDTRSSSAAPGLLSYVANLNLFTEPASVAPEDVDTISRTVMITERYYDPSDPPDISAVTPAPPAPWATPALAGPWSSDAQVPLTFVWLADDAARTVNHFLWSDHPAHVIVGFCDSHVEKVRTNINTQAHLPIGGATPKYVGVP